MELRQLRYFVSIVERGSFGRAARHLFIAQSALSAQMKKLEEELGCRFFVRSASGITLTPQGERFMVHARAILAQVEGATRDLRQAAPADLRGSVHLGMTGAVARMLAMPLLEAMEREFPQLDLHLVEALTVDLERMLQEGELAMAVLFHPSPPQPPLQARVLREEALYLVSPAHVAAARPEWESHPLPFRELASFDLVLPSLRFTLRRLLQEEAQRQGCSLRSRYELDSFSQTLALVNRAGCHSIMLLSSFYPDWQRGDVCAREISELAQTPKTALAWNPERSSRATEAVAELVMRTTESLSHSAHWPLSLRGLRLQAPPKTRKRNTGP